MMKIWESAIPQAIAALRVVDSNDRQVNMAPLPDDLIRYLNSDTELIALTVQTTPRSR